MKRFQKMLFFYSMLFLGAGYIASVSFAPQDAAAGLGSGSWASVPIFGFGGAGSPASQHIKESVCSAGQVMTGTRFYSWTYEVDEEYQQAYCVSMSEATLGEGTWRVAPNAWSRLTPGYKEVICPSGGVMTGTRMYGIFSGVDEEHVDALCSPLQGGATLGAPAWVSPPNRYETMWGGNKDAMCPAGEVMIGTRFYMWASNIDDEHTDAYCAKITFPVPIPVPIPVINLRFGN